MGPRSADRGIVSSVHRDGGARSASMGPRSADRGIIVFPPRVISHFFHASMGPRSADRGISRPSNYSIVNDLRYGQREAIAEPSTSHMLPFPLRRKHSEIK